MTTCWKFFKVTSMLQSLVASPLQVLEVDVRLPRQRQQVAQLLARGQAALCVLLDDAAQRAQDGWSTNWKEDLASASPQGGPRGTSHPELAHGHTRAGSAMAPGRSASVGAKVGSAAGAHGKHGAATSG
eukprot:CAMPEP_0179138554 /NCGR_PEP_ID=MMETSP0796-20121207/66184_1 /TAXON_ID=73915 /ORGANISM="Pyrodinium bahamense, Strain pbaha01" /LENGTH=128 /DNA_ID=CAMNT_0020837857 /DNA_START=190 /DNA_END=574 /DNA_ORIENTATION=+